jgi:hypothetical protein
MFAYARAAIDFWPGWLTEEQFKAAIQSVAEYEDFRDKAFALAKEVGWEGDIREGPFIAGIPTHETADDGHFIIAWKQDNNGDTFVASPYRLPWLETGDYGKWVQG